MRAGGCRRQHRAGHNAFTLIELLVVIAIIAILAGTLFPVFARARESARKIQCLANVKNIAMAVQMYLTDWERTPPWEHRREVTNWFRWGVCDSEEAARLNVARLNPYLGWCLLFDEYVKNRALWRCPSARLESGAAGINGYTDWFAHVVASPDWCTWLSPSSSQSFPSGWGGAVTDGIDQQAYAFAKSGRSAGGAGGEGFAQSIGVLETNRELGLSSVEDTTKFVIVCDIGFQNYAGAPASELAYPDLCGLGTCVWGEGDYCAGTEDCQVIGPKPRQDPTWLRRGTRHLGGSNLGFLDGHAQWWSAEAILAQSPRYAWSCQGSVVYRDLRGFWPSWPTTASGNEAAGIPEGWTDPRLLSGGCPPSY